MNSNRPERSADEDAAARRVVAGVLVGGHSKRMGQPKSLLALDDGEAFLARIVAVLQPRVQRVVLLGNGPVPSGWSSIERLPDAAGLAGPLAGMLAAMRWDRRACWLFAACDLPRLRAEAVDWLLSQRRPDRWAVLPQVTPNQVEPLLALYEPPALELLENLVARGVRSPSSLAGDPAVATPMPPAPLRVCWSNVNTPEDLRRLGGTHERSEE